jgi:EAL domain-containing protein (putative c-di-GMP-specific phosphodiesterase class I)|nr:EAL domain-containing protein [Rhodoferax sp.]
MQPSAAPAPKKTLSELHRRRVRVTLWIGSALLIVMGLGWGLFFFTKQAWAIVAADVAMLVLGITIAILTHRRRTRIAFFLLAGCMLVIICGISLMLDIPDAQAPRSTHHFLLVLALSALLFLRDDRAVLRWGVTGACLLAFVVLASSNFGFPHNYVLPDGMRIWGTWVNNSFSAIGIYLLIHVMVSDFAEHSAMEVDMRRGLLRGEFFLVYQPQVTSHGTVTGAEALLRWRHPALGLIPPDDFIPLAEQSGLILPLGAWVLGSACTQLVAWSVHPDLSHLTLSVNVSVHQFRQEDFVQQVKSAMERTGAQAHQLKLELTESALVHDVADIILKMEQLKKLGVQLSLDDFGTGYSSLTYLKRLPLDQLKIDQSFVRDVLTDPNDAAIARMVIGLGDSLGFAVIAEGVETAGQREFLMQNGCYLFQGDLFSKPVLADALAQLVRASVPPPA